MSEERLVMKLLKAGLEEEAIAEMSREQLINAWAELVAAGREQPKEAFAAAATGKALGYDVDLERQRLTFEMKKFEREIALKEERLAAERKQEEREAAEKEERVAREAAEKEEKLAAERKREEREAAEKEERLEREKAAQRLREAELRLQEEQLARQKERDAWDRDMKKMPAAQAKFFGDVLKNVMPKFPSDVADAPIFFAGVEKLFHSFSVPEELQSKLLMPYLNEKAKSLLLRLEKDKQDVYSEVKKILLRELKLTPVEFKDRFDRAQRNSDETYIMFCSRLKNLLTYYCQSRSVGDSFDKLFSLCVADKIKSTLSEACLDYILTVESNNWLQCDDLADTIDTYLANHTYEGRPKTSGQASSKFHSSNVNSSRKANANNASGYSNNSANKPNYAQSGKSDAKVGGGATESKNGGKNKRLCYICQSPNHRQYNCPTRGSRAVGTSQAKAPVARNFACAVETRGVGETDVDEVPARVTVCPVWSCRD
jgi:flagellar biosynthesis GTPase FlhF